MRELFRLIAAPSELRRLFDFRPKMTILGSRAQMCVNERIQALGGTATDHACRQAMAARACAHALQAEPWTKQGRDPWASGSANNAGCLPHEPVDIEDLLTIARGGQGGAAEGEEGGRASASASRRRTLPEKGPCAFLVARAAMPRAEILFVPYNYLLDSSLRGQLKINWENAVLLFDEARPLSHDRLSRLQYS